MRATLAVQWRLHRIRLAVAVVAGLLVALAGGPPWHRILWDGLLVTIIGWSAGQAREGVPHRTMRLLGPMMVVAGYVLPSTAGLWVVTSWRALGTGLTWLSWGALVVAVTRSAGDVLGVGARQALGSLAVLGVLLTAPVSLDPLMGWLTPAALVACPVVGAARAIGLEVIHQPVVYDMSVLDGLEFHYPPWYSHLLFSLGTVMVLLRTTFGRRR